MLSDIDFSGGRPNPIKPVIVGQKTVWWGHFGIGAGLLLGGLGTAVNTFSGFIPVYGGVIATAALGVSGLAHIVNGFIVKKMRVDHPEFSEDHPE